MQGTSEVTPEPSEEMKLFYELASKIKRVKSLEHLTIHYRFTIHHKKQDDRKHVSRKMVSKIIAEKLNLKETEDYHVYSTGNNKLIWCKNYLNSSKIITDDLKINLYLQTNGHLLVTKSIDVVCRDSFKEFTSEIGIETHSWEEDKSMWVYFSKIKKDDFTKITTYSNESGFDLNFFWYKIECKKPPQPLFERKLYQKPTKLQNNNNTYAEVVKTNSTKYNNLIEPNKYAFDKPSKNANNKRSRSFIKTPEGVKPEPKVRRIKSPEKHERSNPDTTSSSKEESQPNNPIPQTAKDIEMEESTGILNDQLNS